MLLNFELPVPVCLSYYSYDFDVGVYVFFVNNYMKSLVCSRINAVLLLIVRCLQEHGYLQMMPTVENLQRLIGFTLFLGELLVNMKVCMFVFFILEIRRNSM